MKEILLNGLTIRMAPLSELWMFNKEELKPQNHLFFYDDYGRNIVMQHLAGINYPLVSEDDNLFKYVPENDEIIELETG